MTGGLRPNFADRLAALVEERRSRVVLGLDPDPAALWPPAVVRLGAGGPAEPHLARIRTAEAVLEHCRGAIVAAGPACVAVKPQLACFERLGAPGWEALEQVVAIAHDHGLLVIADGKRGDVPVTARAYAQALVGETPGPVRPRRRASERTPSRPTRCSVATRSSRCSRPRPTAGAGCFVLVRTSNPGAAELQDEGEPPLHERLARLVDELGAELRGECGLSAVGAVTGATRPDHLERLRELMPHAIFLLPGRGRPGRPRRGARARPSRRTRRRGS